MTAKRTLPAKEILADIRAGISDGELLRKYGLSTQGLQVIFDKLIKAGLLSQAELDQRAAALEQAVDLDTGTVASEMTLLLWKCPACHMPQPHEYEECPQCGILVSKFLEKQVKLRQPTQVVKAEEPPTVQTEPQLQESADVTCSPGDAAPQPGKVIQVDLDAGIRLAKGLLHKAKKAVERVVDSVHNQVIRQEAGGISSPVTTDLEEAKTSEVPQSLAKQPSSNRSDSSIRPEDKSRKLWRCPVCHIQQTLEHAKCPQCGVIVDKHWKGQEREGKEQERLKGLQERRAKVIHVLIRSSLPLGIIGVIGILMLFPVLGYLVACAGIIFAAFKAINYYDKGRSVSLLKRLSESTGQGVSMNRRHFPIKWLLAGLSLIVLVYIGISMHESSVKERRAAEDYADSIDSARRDARAITREFDAINKEDRDTTVEEDWRYYRVMLGASSKIQDPVAKRQAMERLERMKETIIMKENLIKQGLWTYPSKGNK